MTFSGAAAGQGCCYPGPQSTAHTLSRHYEAPTCLWSDPTGSRTGAGRGGKGKQGEGHAAARMTASARPWPPPSLLPCSHLQIQQSLQAAARISGRVSPWGPPAHRPQPASQVASILQEVTSSALDPKPDGGDSRLTGLRRAELAVAGMGHDSDLAKHGQCPWCTPAHSCHPCVAYLRVAALTAACRLKACGSCCWRSRPCGGDWRRHWPGAPLSIWCSAGPTRCHSCTRLWAGLGSVHSARPPPLGPVLGARGRCGLMGAQY